MHLFESVPHLVPAMEAVLAGWAMMGLVLTGVSALGVRLMGVRRVDAEFRGHHR
jgi:hypothetical protein